MAQSSRIENIKNEVTNDIQGFLTDLLKNRTTSPRELIASIQGGLVAMQTRVSTFGLDSADHELSCVIELKRSVVAL